VNAEHWHPWNSPSKWAPKTGHPIKLPLSFIPFKKYTLDKTTIENLSYGTGCEKRVLSAQKWTEIWINQILSAGKANLKNQTRIEG
jgi:hypothetical protein